MLRSDRRKRGTADSTAASSLIQRLVCDVDYRLGLNVVGGGKHLHAPLLLPSASLARCGRATCQQTRLALLGIDEPSSHGHLVEVLSVPIFGAAPRSSHTPSPQASCLYPSPLAAGTPLLLRLLQNKLPSPFPSLVQAHPFFNGVDWDNLYQCPAPMRPQVEHELDTQV